MTTTTTHAQSVDAMVMELCDLGYILGAAEEFRTCRFATAALLKKADEVQWVDNTNPLLMELCRPHVQQHCQQWLSGPTFTAVLVWQHPRFVMHSIFLSGGLLTFYPHDAEFDGPSVSVCDTAPVCLPLPLSDFKRMLSSPPGGAPVTGDRLALALAAYDALHETFGL